ncbi:MAG: tetratricopeptide repeat protein [Proteiniphilum sp.]|nr:tetratricopeptide repeat protein [Proteiniphilum sp.]MDD4158447.1 tetratricopeptide repeat protein [Proteiniphilum sp.]MDD4799416.1 tetratricopeptide repeat protein [Proteiniphilum sp.]
MNKIILLLCFFVIAAPAVVVGQHSGVQTLIREGVALHDEGEYEKAIGKYMEALGLEPNCIQAVYELSLSYLALKDYANAEKYSAAVIESENKQLSPGAYAVKSEALGEMGQADKAIALLQQGLEKYGDEYLLHFNLAINYYKQGDTDKALIHVRRAIDLDKTPSGAFLLNAYVLNEKGLWVQSILSFQMFLLLEPDSKRSKNAFEEMLQTMCLKKSEAPVERSFIQQQMMRNKPEASVQPNKMPPLTTEEGLDRSMVYRAITGTLDSLKKNDAEADEFKLFMTVNRKIMKVLEAESIGPKEGIFWTYYIPFFAHIEQSDYYNTFCRYISVSYYPESLEWWQQHKDAAGNFVRWFENGDDN